ncbi:MAG: BglII/BstYI family type II restriction endonuclease [Bacteroidales bacterium]
MNGEEYLIVHHNNLYKEIKEVIANIDAETLRTKVSKEKRKIGNNLLSPIDLNKSFHESFYKRKWEESRYNYYITLDRELMEQSILMTAKEQKEFLISNGEKEPIYSYNQTDFVKDKIAVEVQFGKYAFVAFDLFVKHMLFYSGGKINLGIEILPTKKMQSQMSSGVAYYEGEVYNVMRQGRNSPPVPLLILGIEP